MPRKRKTGKQQVNSWVDESMAKNIKTIQKTLKLRHRSDAVQYLLEIGLAAYETIENSSVRKNRH